MSKLTVPLIKANDLFAIIEGHVFMTIYKKKKKSPCFQHELSSKYQGLLMYSSK